MRAMQISDKRIFWTLVALVYALRVFSALQDGLSDRAIVDGMQVGWWAWHVFGWLSRDVIQIVLLFPAGMCLPLRTWLAWAFWFGFNGMLNLVLHVWLYWWAVYHQGWFLW